MAQQGGGFRWHFIAGGFWGDTAAHGADAGPILVPLADYVTLAGGPDVARPCLDRFKESGRIVDHLGVPHLAFPFWTPVLLDRPEPPKSPW